MGTFNGDMVVEKIIEYVKTNKKIPPYIVGISSDDKN